MIKNKKLLFAALVLVFSLFAPDLVGASQLTQASVSLGRLGTNAGTGGAGDKNDLLVTFKLNTTPTNVAKITVTFPVGFTIATGTPSVGTTFPNTPASITAPPGSLTAASTAGSRTIVVSGLTSASLNNTTLYGFTIPAGTITNPGTTGQYVPTVESNTSGGATIDLTSAPIFITTSSSGDQITVHESVSPNFSFSLSSNTDTVPGVDTSVIQTSPGVTMVVGTNSPLGYTAYVKSANAALTSAVSPGTPIATGTFDGSPDTVTAGTTKYGLVPSTGPGCSSCTGSLTYDGEFAVVDGTHAGSFNSTNFASFVSRNGYTNADQVSLKERVAVANTVGYANDYTDTLTVVAAGNY